MNRRTVFGLALLPAFFKFKWVRAATDPEKQRYIIMPDITKCERCTKTQHDNAYTLHYEWMCRVDVLTDVPNFEVTHVNTKRYREWLVDYHTETGLPPHIQFGGGVKSIPGGDPTFYDRWLAYARETFVEL